MSLRQAIPGELLSSIARFRFAHRSHPKPKLPVRLPKNQRTANRLKTRLSHAWGSVQTVIRGGAGIVYGSLDSSAATGYASNAAIATTPAFGQIAGLLQNGIPSTVQAAWPTLNNPAAGQAPGAVVSAPSLLDQNTGRPARLTQWNITVQRTFGKDIAVEAGYVGNVGVWETAPTVLPTGLPPGYSTLAPVNVLSLSELAALGISGSNLSNATLSSAFNTSISALTAAAEDRSGVRRPHAVPPL